MPFSIVRNDITKMKVDVIVNTANEEPIYSNGTDTAVYEAAGAEELLRARQKIGYLEEGEVHKIKSNEKYKPSKQTVIAFALSLRLDLNETNDLLKRAGFALSPSNQYDLIIQFFIERKIYDIYKINSVLFDYNEKCFGC